MKKKNKCCPRVVVVTKGAWTPLEDELLTTYVNRHGPSKWSHIPQKTGLNRAAKSCRLRWLNYLRPGIKVGNISEDEHDLIARLHKLLGNRWSLISGRIPGRTDNEIKNYWNTTKKKKNLVKKSTEVETKISVQPVENNVVIMNSSSAPSLDDISLKHDEITFGPRTNQLDCCLMSSSMEIGFPCNDIDGTLNYDDDDTFMSVEDLLLENWGTSSTNNNFLDEENHDMDLDSLGMFTRLNYECIFN